MPSPPVCAAADEFGAARAGHAFMTMFVAELADWRRMVSDDPPRLPTAETAKTASTFLTATTTTVTTRAEAAAT